MIQNERGSLQPFDETRGSHLDSGCLDGVEQHIEEGRAMHRQPTRRAQCGIAHIEHHSPRAAGLAVKPVDAGSQPAHARAKSKPVEHGKSHRLKNEPGPQWPQRLELVEQHHAMAQAGQRQRRRKPRRPTAGNGNLKRLHAPPIAGGGPGFRETGR